MAIPRPALSLSLLASWACVGLSRLMLGLTLGLAASARAVISST